ncbi:MAG: hypothetical protein H6981_02960 [Gammaproteobacteria bacterium]|nr:hypothetical protein [Gammaproteobacteria bacterium]MCP5135749.1 hypothetical protein [Gammaproteobacteria bacterium]
MNKLIIAALVGGVFAGGMLAPESWRNAVQDQLNKVTGKAPASAPAPASTATAGKDAPPPVKYADMQRPLSLAKGEKLGLGLGLYASTPGGDALAGTVAKLGYALQFVAVQDDSGSVWQMLIAGEYDNADDAERDRSILADALQGVAAPEIVLIPPPPAKK